VSKPRRPSCFAVADGRARKPRTRKGAQKTPQSRSGAPWPGERPPAEERLGPVARDALGVLRGMRVELGRAPKPSELAARLGLGPAALAAVLDELAEVGLGSPLKLTEPQKRCLKAIIALEARLGRSPSTREVSDEMGLSPSASRFHIRKLVAMGLVTPPRMVLVLSATAAGKALAA
jgi:DNA-binding MarR family transcriptional regulator